MLREGIVKDRLRGADAQAVLNSGKLFATVQETAVILRIDERTLRSMIKRGEVPSIRAGSQWRIPTDWLRAATGAAPQAGEPARAVL
jgi:excisionase family DNA binding protein